MRAGAPEARVHKLGTLPPCAQNRSIPDDGRPWAENDPVALPVPGIPAGAWIAHGHSQRACFRLRFAFFTDLSTSGTDFLSPSSYSL